MSVEFKCPLPMYCRSTPVYYEVMKRHILQSMLEMKVLGTSEHLYISWSEVSTTVFKLVSNANIIDKALEKIYELYYSRNTEVPHQGNGGHQATTGAFEHSPTIGHVCRRISINKTYFICTTNPTPRQ